ncbi:MAG TPA: cytochrome c oxidase subunit II [Gemmatimonadaceae bacterium]|nr:cytochrome c oxidase subunit II [Gemmatimonadaceae bacterium]
MNSTHRPRQFATAAAAAVLVLALAACSEQYPNSTFTHLTEFNTAIDALWDKLLFWGTLVFVLVEGLLIWTVIKFRRREGAAEPKHVHGNTTLEILWTAIPALILVFIAVPTVRTIFKTQAKAVPNALQVEVIGHQWWWEFRYPEYTSTGANGRVDTLVTANELYVPKGRTVNFALRTNDVLHSFWIPQLGGKRDLIANHTNYLWFTPDSTLDGTVFNGFCVEYCGASHANMHFRAYTLEPAEFERWVQHQLSPAVVAARMPGGAPVPAPAAPAAPGDRAAPGDSAAAAAAPTPATLASAQTGTVPPAELPDWAVPDTPLPAGVAFDDRLLASGDVARGAEVYSRSACVGCHMIKGHPISMGVLGPNLTHFGSRNVLAASMYPNDARHLARWIKNARVMKPGVGMPTLGKGLVDPVTGAPVTAGGLTDQEIADIVAYLMALK